MSFFRTVFSKQFLITLLLLCILAIFVVPLTKNWRQKRAIDQEISELEKQVSEYENKNSSLKKVLDYMKSNEFVEKEARTKLNYKKAGEQVTIIKDLPGDVQSAITNSSLFDLPPEPPEPHDAKLIGNIEKWIKYLFKK